MNATYDDVEYVLAEILAEATGEPRVGRLERTLAKAALARLRELGLSLSSPPADDVREALAARLAEHAERYTRFYQPCGDSGCRFMVRKGDGGWNHVDTHGAEPGHPAIGLLTAAAQALAGVRPYGTVTDTEASADGAWEKYRFANWINPQREPYTEGIFRAGFRAAREARS